MKLLAIDSSGLTASVALLDGDILTAEYTIDYKKTHSQTLLPMIDEIVRMTEQKLEELDVIAVAEGPGSFTGLRIGAATAKGLGLSLKKKLIGVPTVDAMAYNLFGVSGVICPMMDARRNQVYTGLYSFRKAEFVILSEQKATGVEELIEEINLRGQETIFLGDGVPVYQQLLEDKLTVPYTFAPAHVNRQRAAAVGALAVQYYREGKLQTAAEHAPVYLRLSQAERERKEREERKQQG